MKGKKVCYIADMAHHYRAPIFKRMADDLDCDFYFGDRSSSVKSMDLDGFSGFKGSLKYIKIFGHFHLLMGAVSVALKYDVVILLGDPRGLHNWIICAFFKVLGRPAVLWTHGWYGKESGVTEKVKLFFFKTAAKIWVYGPRSKSLLRLKGFSEDKVDVVFNSLDYGVQRKVAIRSDNSPRVKYFPNNHPVVCYVGRVQAIKRLDLVVESMKLLRDRNIVVNFLIVGSLVDGGRTKELVERLGLCEQVLFFGPCYSEDELCDVFRSSDVCVSPGNVGLTAIHSLTYGCPVITHSNYEFQMPEVEAVVEGKTGDFFKFNSAFDLSNKIEKWAGLSCEEKKLISLSCKSEVAKRWNPEAQVSIMRDSLRGLICGVC